MSDEKTVLDLDELLGQRKQIKVRRNGVEHDFSDMNALSAKEVIQIQTMRQKIARLQILDDLNEEQSKEIEKLFDGILAMLCKDIPLAEISYVEKTTILAFYFTESQTKKAMSPKKE